MAAKTSPRLRLRAAPLMRRAVLLTIIRTVAVLSLQLALTSAAWSQATLVLNGAAIILTNKATLTIGNSAHTAILRNGGGYIQSEAAGNRIIWAIGAGDGDTYTIPFGNSTNYFPLNFNASGGTAAAAGGTFELSTYPTPPTNSTDLPPGVTNMTIASGDNSVRTVDRFWELKPQGYSGNPDLTDLQFTFTDAEIATPNTITESSLSAYRWNDALQKWNDYTPASSVNNSTNTVTVATVPGSQLHDWWTLADAGNPLPLTLLSFYAKPVAGVVLVTWETTNETNTDHFLVLRSKDGTSFDQTGEVAARGNTNNVMDYSFTDEHPYQNTSYYRLESVDRDGAATYSAIASVALDGKGQVQLYPSPASTQITISSSPDLVETHAVVSVYDAGGRQIRTIELTGTSQLVDISRLAPGVYTLAFTADGQLKTLRFIKL